MTSTNPTRTTTQTAWGSYEHDGDLLSAAMSRTVAELRAEIKSTVGGEPLNWSAFWRMPKAHLAAIVSEWATFERQNAREFAATSPESTLTQSTVVRVLEDGSTVVDVVDNQADNDLGETDSYPQGVHISNARIEANAEVIARKMLGTDAPNCGQPWGAEIELCPRCGKSALEHVGIVRDQADYDALVDDMAGKLDTPAGLAAAVRHANTTLAAGMADTAAGLADLRDRLTVILGRLGYAPAWADVLPDNCRCKYVNRSDNGGWELKSRNPNCTVHGDPKANDRATWVSARALKTFDGELNPFPTYPVLSDCHEAGKCLNNLHFGECGYWTVDNRDWITPEKSGYVITIVRESEEEPGDPWPLKTIVAEHGSLLQSLNSWLTAQCIVNPHDGEYRIRQEDGSVLRFQWVFKTHVALSIRREAFLYELGDMLNVANYAGVIAAVKERGAFLGKTAQWRAACSFFNQTDRDPAWVATQGHIGLTHANA